MVVVLAENEGIEGLTFVVTAGASSIGAALCLELVRRDAHEVRCFYDDNSSSSPWLPSLKRNRVVCIPGDIRRKDDVDKALRGANCVFHLASHGTSGKEMLQARQIDEVNLNGTCNILDSCIKHGVERLVYTSSYNVVFGGQEIRNGNESMDYFPMETHVDSCGRSKALAEQLVLKSNNRPLKGRTGRKLYTCAIRPAAVYGPGEEHYLPRIVSLAKKGLFLFLIGGPEVQTDWVYVDNLVHAELLASMALIDDIPGRKGAPAGGQAYFISDGKPVNSFSFLYPLIEGLGYKFPHFRLSVNSATVIAWLFWGLYGLLYPWLDKWWLPQPVILPAEVYKVGVTHYFSILKARQQLNYIPLIDPKEGMKRTIDYWKDKQTKELESPPLLQWLVIGGGLFLLFLFACVPPPFLGLFEWLRSLCLFFFRTGRNMQICFLLAMLAHVGEAVYARILAEKVDRFNTEAWFWQTLVVGYPSLRLLLRRARKAGLFK